MQAHSHSQANPFSFPCTYPSLPLTSLIPISLSLISHPCKPIPIHASPFSFPCTYPSLPLTLLIPISLSKLSSMQTHSHPCKPILIPMQTHTLHARHTHFPLTPIVEATSFHHLSIPHAWVYSFHTHPSCYAYPILTHACKNYAPNGCHPHPLIRENHLILHKICYIPIRFHKIWLYNCKYM